MQKGIFNTVLSKIAVATLAASFIAIAIGTITLPMSQNSKVKSTLFFDIEGMNKLGTGHSNWLQQYDANNKALMNKEELKSIQNQILDEYGSKTKYAKAIKKMSDEFPASPIKDEYNEISKSIISNNSMNIAGIIMLSLGGAALLGGAGIMFYDFSKCKKLYF
ncbi:MAG: hypothetical protein ACRC4M_02880 [Mycoplasma sp.]